VTVLPDKEREIVIVVLDGWKTNIVNGWFKTQEVADFSPLESVLMDISGSYMKVVQDNFDRVLELVYFNRFHVSQLFNKAPDKVRREKYRSLTDGIWERKSAEESPFWAFCVITIVPTIGARSGITFCR